MADTAHKQILITAGEASGDRYGARLVGKLRSICGDGQSLEFFGTGGDEMQGAGVHLLAHVRELAHIGPREQISHLPRYIRIFKDVVQASRDRRPSVAVLIDFPDFNLWLAKRLKRAGIPVVYYISPQLWAWRHYRIGAVRKYVEQVACHPSF